MGHHPNGDWDGVCACGKRAMDGKRCKLGASHTASTRAPRGFVELPPAKKPKVKPKFEEFENAEDEFDFG